MMHVLTVFHELDQMSGWEHDWTSLDICFDELFGFEFSILACLNIVVRGRQLKQLRNE